MRESGLNCTVSFVQYALTERVMCLNRNIGNITIFVPTTLPPLGIWKLELHPLMTFFPLPYPLSGIKKLSTQEPAPANGPPFPVDRAIRRCTKMRHLSPTCASSSGLRGKGHSFRVPQGPSRSGGVSSNGRAIRLQTISHAVYLAVGGTWKSRTRDGGLVLSLVVRDEGLR